MLGAAVLLSVTVALSLALLFQYFGIRPQSTFFAIFFLPAVAASAVIGGRVWGGTAALAATGVTAFYIFSPTDSFWSDREFIANLLVFLFCVLTTSEFTILALGHVPIAPEQSALEQINEKLLSDQSHLNSINARLLADQTALSDINTKLLGDQRALNDINSKLMGDQSALRGIIAKLEGDQAGIRHINAKLLERQADILHANKQLAARQSAHQPAAPDGGLVSSVPAPDVLIFMHLGKTAGSTFNKGHLEQ